MGWVNKGGSMSLDFDYQDVELHRVYLDNENPRHDPLEAEPEIIAHLIAEEDVKALAKSIAELGTTSPLERIGLIAHPKVKGAFLAVEGNRRMCALKLLADPDKADTEANKKYFRGLAKKMGELPDALDAVVFHNRKKARPWVSLRHEGAQGGVGTKEWRPEQKARFNVDGTGGTAKVNPDIQALAVKEYALKHGLLARAEVDSISLTTLTRYLSNPVFREALGLEGNRTLHITVPEEEFKRAVTKFLKDALEPNSGVSSRTDVAERKRYAEKLRSDGIAPVTRGLKAHDVSVSARPVDAANSDKDSRERNGRSPDARPKVIPHDFVAKIKNRTLKRLYDELRGLDAELFSFAATYLLRAVIEQTVTLYLEKRGQGIQGELHRKLERVANLLENDGMPARQLKNLRMMATEKDSRYSPDSIGHFVHGGAIPTRVQAIKLWDSIQDIMEVLFKELNS